MMYGCMVSREGLLVPHATSKSVNNWGTCSIANYYYQLERKATHTMAHKRNEKIATQYWYIICYAYTYIYYSIRYNLC